MLLSQADFQELKHYTFTLSIHANPNYFRRRLNVYSITVTANPRGFAYGTYCMLVVVQFASPWLGHIPRASLLRRRLLLPNTGFRPRPYSCGHLPQMLKISTSSERAQPSHHISSMDSNNGSSDGEFDPVRELSDRF